MTPELAAIALDPNGDPYTKQLLRDAVINGTSSDVPTVQSRQAQCTDDVPPLEDMSEQAETIKSKVSQSAGLTQSTAVQQNGYHIQVHIWKEEEEKLLLELRLGEESSFNSVKNHEVLWNKITQEMNAKKVNVTKAQIIKKWKTMKKKVQRGSRPK